MAAVSGSRLKAKIITGEDGTKIIAGFYDTNLSTDCAFSEAEDGKQRCLPIPVASASVPLAGTGLPQAPAYLDAGCTLRVATSPLCNPPVKYVRFTDTCGSRPRIAEAIEMNGPGGFFHREPSNGMCYSDNFSFAQLRLYTIGRPMAPTEFVAGDVSMQ